MIAIDARECPTCGERLFHRSASQPTLQPERFCERVEDKPFEAWGRQIVQTYEVHHVHHSEPIQLRQQCASGHVFEWVEPRVCPVPGCSHKSRMPE